MKSPVTMLLILAVVRATRQSGFQQNEAPYHSFKDENGLFEDKVSRRSANYDTDRTIQIKSPSDLSLEFLTNLFNLTTEDLELSYETIWYLDHEQRRVITIKRAGGQAQDEKTLDTKDDHQITRKQSDSLIQHRVDSRQGLRAKRVIIGDDERKELPALSKAQKTPHSAVCKVSCKGLCAWSCSGILIGSRHVLTSAHCLKGVTAGTLQTGFLERNGRLHWYDVTKAYIPLTWKTSKALADDYAVLKLTRPPNRSFVTVSSVALPKGSMIYITGFPGDKAPNSLWLTKCPVLTVTSGLIWNKCDAARGSSGSGVFVKDRSRTTVVGVLSGERAITRRGQRLRLNVAVYLTRSKVTQINGWTQL